MSMIRSHWTKINHCVQICRQEVKWKWIWNNLLTKGLCIYCNLKKWGNIMPLNATWLSPPTSLYPYCHALRRDYTHLLTAFQEVLLKWSSCKMIYRFPSALILYQREMEEKSKAKISSYDPSEEYDPGSLIFLTLRTNPSDRKTAPPISLSFTNCFTLLWLPHIFYSNFRPKLTVSNGNYFEF